MNVNSILAIADDLGHIHSFLDGNYPLGAVPLGSETSTYTLFKYTTQPVFLAHPRTAGGNPVHTDLSPAVVELPLLRTRKPRDMARLSSTTRELVWYVMRVVKEMRVVWFGSDTFNGARELGPKWIRALEAKQKEQFGRKSESPLYFQLSVKVLVKMKNRMECWT